MEQRVKNSVINSYGFILFSSAFLITMSMTYWAYFMTDVAKMPPILMAKTLLVANIVDWCMVFVASIAMQKLYPKIKYRTWLLIGPIIMAACFAVMFAPITAPVGVKAIIYGGAYCIQTGFQIVAFGAANTMIPVLGKLQEDRSAFSARKAVGNNLGKIGFGLITLPLILMINGGEKAAAPGFFVMVIIYGLFFIGTTANFYRLAKSGDAEATALEAKGEKTSILDMFKLFFSNKHLVSAILADSTRLLAQFIIYGLAVYYFRYVLNSMPKLSIFLTSIAVAGVIGSLVGEFLQKKFDKRYVYMSGLGLLVVCLIVNFIAATTNVTTFIAILDIGFFGMMVANSSAVAILSDATLYSELKSGKELKGFMMTMGMLVPKLGNLISGIVVGFGLAGIGYVANTPMSAETMSGLVKIINLVPAAFLILGILILYFFNKLSTSKVTEIQAEIAARKSNAA